MDPSPEVLGVRALQLAKGAPAFVDVQGESDVMVIARRELTSGKMPLNICRRLPNGETDTWDVNKLYAGEPHFGT